MSEDGAAGKPPQSKVAMAVVCWFAGCLGIHRLMMGHKNWWLMLVTLGGCGIWTIIDFIQILTGGLKMEDGQDLT
jgi:TM2 domain-containing membrane protein YozV